MRIREQDMRTHRFAHIPASQKNALSSGSVLSSIAFDEVAVKCSVCCIGIALTTSLLLKYGQMARRSLLRLVLAMLLVSCSCSAITRQTNIWLSSAARSEWSAMLSRQLRLRASFSSCDFGVHRRNSAQLQISYRSF